MDLQILATINMNIAIAAWEAETRNKRTLVETIMNYVSVLEYKRIKNKRSITEDYLMNLDSDDLLNKSREILSEVKRKDKKGYFRNGITEFEQNINMFTRTIRHSKQY